MCATNNTVERRLLQHFIALREKKSFIDSKPVPETSPWKLNEDFNILSGQALYDLSQCESHQVVLKDSNLAPKNESNNQMLFMNGVQKQDNFYEDSCRSDSEQPNSSSDKNEQVD